MTAARRLTASGGCDQPTPTGPVTCPISGLYIVFVHLGDGDDALVVDNHDPSVQFTIGAGEGADSVDVGPLGEVCLDGNAGVDHLTLTTPSEACTVDGGEGRDVLTGSDGLDRLYGGPDPDVVLGQGGNDYVYGDDGNDRVDGGPGNEVLIDGGPGDDTLAGEGGDDHFDDGPGDDEFEGDSGADTFSSSFFFDSGDDAYTGGPGRDRLVYFCPACRISLDHTANDGRPSIGEADNVDVEALSVPSRVPPDPDEGDPGHNYGTGNDTLVGDAQDNLLVAQRGDDQLSGRGGVDVLSAGHGADTIRAADGVADSLVDCGPGRRHRVRGCARHARGLRAGARGVEAAAATLGVRAPAADAPRVRKPRRQRLRERALELGADRPVDHPPGDVRTDAGLGRRCPAGRCRRSRAARSRRRRGSRS